MAGTAIFDLDRTITRQPTWTWFLLHVNGRNPLFWLRMTGIVGRMIGYKLRLVPRDAIKAAGVRTLAGQDRATLQAKADRFVAGLLNTGLRPGARAAIAAHKARGDRLVLVTAAVDVVADPLARALGFDDVIATGLTWPPGARGPAIDGANCYGAEKLRRMEALQAARPFARPIHAYSDHLSDLDLLTLADHGIAVNPSSGLRHAARAHGLEIVDFEHSQSLPVTLETPA
ncbi:haloacid dehalogenase-like hydrolase [Roseovarius sp. A-2]|uniref:HAD family hydrolase n=1 Tax=Roseovarius sp. A-2 TaxID=1570360 RepID=UPI0009B50A11|nr:HAD-IB family hydrolase [Roseovarius sp. A-2]GAW33337.1 haloacid dehalogenase-like hydrolase [Roseovarius sp. A-2]